MTIPAEAARKWIIEVTITITPQQTTILPPWTGKILKTLVLADPCMTPARQALGQHRSYKPGRVTPLYRGNTPLYKKKGDTKPLTAHPGETLTGTITVVATNPLQATTLHSCQGPIPGPWKTLHYKVTKIEVHQAVALKTRIQARQPITIQIETPLLLPTKIPLPPVSWAQKLSKRIPPAHRLLPTPGYILAAAARTLQGALLNTEAVTSPLTWKAYLIGETSIAEITYNLHPQTVLYTKGEKGLKLIRGVIGTITLIPLTRTAANLLSTLLPIAEKLGIGRSRAIGLGKIKIKL